MFVAHCCDTLKTVSANNVLFLSSKQIHSLLYISFFLYQYICYQYVFSYRNHDITKPYLHKTLRIIYALYFHIEFRVHQPLELVTIYHSTKVCSLKMNRVRHDIDMTCIFFFTFTCNIHFISIYFYPKRRTSSAQQRIRDQQCSALQFQFLYHSEWSESRNWLY